jgi:hypothetical protein
MNRFVRWLAGWYPQWWRARYGAEFDALLDDADLKWRDGLGVLLYGVEIRMHTTAVPRIVSLASRDIPHGYELESSVEMPRKDGGTLMVRNFCREVDLGDSYLTLNHCSRGSAPPQTILVFGRKGEVDGDFRTDETEMLVLRPDGTVQRTEQTVKTWLKADAIRDGLRDRYRSGMAAGLSPDEIYRRLTPDDYGSANA